MEVKLPFQLSPAFLLDTASALLVKGMQSLMQILNKKLHDCDGQ